MRQITKQMLIQEGVLDAIRNNSGKLALGAGTIIAAKAGILGSPMKNVADTSISATNNFIKDSSKRLTDTYGEKATQVKNAVHDATKTTPVTKEAVPNAHADQQAINLDIKNKIPLSDKFSDKLSDNLNTI